MFWYEQDVQDLEKIKEQFGDKGEVIFYGSSSFRLWKSLNEELASIKPINLGFGGSTLAACVWYFDRVLSNLNPKGFVIYAGDNDLGDGRHPEEVFIFFKQIVAQIRSNYGNIPIIYISIKPSIRRFNIIEQIKYTNKIIEAEIAKNMDEKVFYLNIFDEMTDNSGYPIRDLFEPEGLHINKKGYALWATLFNKLIEKNNIQF